MHPELLPRTSIKGVLLGNNKEDVLNSYLTSNKKHLILPNGLDRNIAKPIPPIMSPLPIEPTLPGQKPAVLSNPNIPGLGAPVGKLFKF
jgi:hypothetical protein